MAANVFFQRRSHGLFLGFVPTGLSGLLDQAIVNCQVRSHV
jgi:hypothetical protein